VWFSSFASLTRSTPPISHLEGGDGEVLFLAKLLYCRENQLKKSASNFSAVKEKSALREKEFLATRLKRLVEVQVPRMGYTVDCEVARRLDALPARVKVSERKNLIGKIDLVKLFFEHVVAPTGRVANRGCLDRAAFSFPIDHWRQDQAIPVWFPFLEKLTITRFELNAG